MKEIAKIGGRSRTILLVDDEEPIRELAERILKRAGYEVITAAEGKEALDAYKREQGNVALVILDLVMPRMGGKECLKELLKMNPAARVLISSGVSADDEAEWSVRPFTKGFVNKPYGVKGLLRAVRDALETD